MWIELVGWVDQGSPRSVVALGVWVHLSRCSRGLSREALGRPRRLAPNVCVGGSRSVVRVQALRRSPAADRSATSFCADPAVSASMCMRCAGVGLACPRPCEDHVASVVHI